MKRLFLSAAVLSAAVSGHAFADHQSPNLKAFKTVCVSAAFEDQGEENDAVLDNLLDQIVATLEDAGIRVDRRCKTENGVTGKTQLNVYYSFATTKSGQVFNAVLDGWLNTSGSYTDVTLWHDSFFGSIDAGDGSLEAEDNLSELLESFIEGWDSVH